MINLDVLPPYETQKLKMTAIIDTALCVGAGGSSGSLADKPIVRNAAGQLIIPGSQIKGRLRHECEKLASALGWQIFYAPTAEALSPNNKQVLPQFRDIYQIPGYKGYHCIVSQIFGNPILPSRIVVEDLICPLRADELLEVLRPGVTINRRRRTSEERKLYLLETSPANAQLMFAGDIHLLPPLTSSHPNISSSAKPLILAALHRINALGGSKSAGLGWLQWQNLPTITADDPVWSNLVAIAFFSDRHSNTPVGGTV